jgi:prepilin-type N-terminal cleavage/methylation domain-containing protein/prepilin-type processing-associated H-X9-DG protein
MTRHPEAFTLTERPVVRTRERSAFTLIELLVVISIIGVLMALLLPAVMGSRESARRTQCLSNMHNLGIALLQYHDTSKMFPPGVIHVNDNVGPRTSWAALILPLVDERILYNSYNFNSMGATSNTGSSASLVNTTVCQQALNVFRCPSDTGSNIGDFGVSNYAGCAGDGADVTCGAADPTLCNHWPEAANGVLFRNSNTKIKRIQNRDGTSRTIMLGETCVHAGDAAMWAHGPSVIRTTYDNMSDWRTKTGSAGNNLRARSFRSLHPGGAHFLMCDGVVKFLSESIDMSVFHGLATIRGGEIIGDDDY